MSTKELKDRIHTLVEQVPDDYLETVKTYLSALSANEIVPQLGTTVAAYNQELDSAMERHHAGASVPHEQAMVAVRARIQKYRNDDKLG